MLIVFVIFTQFLHIAFMQNVLKTEPVSFDTWLMLKNKDQEKALLLMPLINFNHRINSLTIFS